MYLDIFSPISFICVLSWVTASKFNEENNLQLNYACPSLIYIWKWDGDIRKTVMEIDYQYLGYKWERMEGNKLHLICNNKSTQNVNKGLQMNQIQDVKVTAVNFLPHIGLIEKGGEMIMKGFCGHFYSIFHTTFNISFKIIKNNAGQFGSFIDNTKWTGMIGDTVDGSADIASCVTITKKRRNALEFSPELFSVDVEVLYRNLDGLEWDLGFYLKPYSKALWLGIFFINSIVLLINFLSNYLHKNVVHAPNYDFSENEIFLCWPIVLQGKFLFFSIYSIKFCFVIYLLFSIILLSTYTSLLTAFFATVKAIIPFYSLKEMVDDASYLPILLNGSSTQDILLSFYQNKSFIEISSVEEAIDAVFTIKAGYLTLGIDVSRLIKDNCSFSFAPFAVDREIISLAYSKHFSYKEFFNTKILQLRDRGLLAVLKSRYLSTWRNCESDSLVRTIPYRLIIGPFILFTSGVVISVVFLVLEIVVVKLNV